MNERINSESQNGDAFVKSFKQFIKIGAMRIYEHGSCDRGMYVEELWMPKKGYP